MEMSSMCRICLVEGVKMYSLISAKLQELYERLTDIPFMTKNKKPEQVCYLCHARLQNCYRLQATCLKNEEFFNKVMANNEFKQMESQDLNTLKTVHPLIRISCVPSMRKDTDDDDKIDEKNDFKFDPSAITPDVQVKDELYEADSFINEAVDIKLEVTVKDEDICTEDGDMSDNSHTMQDIQLEHDLERKPVEIVLERIDLEQIKIDPADITDSSENMPEVEEKICFICGLTGDPINNKLKNLSSTILNNCINAIEVRKISQSDRSRKSLDVSIIQLPKDLEEKGYHQQCYKQLTNLSGKRKFEENDDTSQCNEDSQNSTREYREGNDQSPSKPTANSCVFCTQVRKKQRGELMSCNFAKEDNNYETFRIVIDKATQVFELSLLERIDTYQEHNLPIPYHRSCKAEFLNKCRQKKENTDWHRRREKHERAREHLYVFIEENVVGKMQIFQFTFIKNLFRQFLLEEYNSDQLPQCFDTGNLQSQIENKFKGKVKIIYNHNRKYIVSSSAILGNVNMIWVNDINTIHTSALILRRIILKIEKNTISRNVRVSHLIKGECEVPNILIEFFAILLTGGNVDKIKNPRILLLANSFAQDIIYAVRRGHIKISKHVTLGLALKNLTSSEKIVRLVHAYGHCISYTKVLELETEATYTIANTNRFCPAEMILQPHLNSGFAFDNFDRYVETCDRKDTLRHTVGISFQDHISVTDVTDLSADDNSDIHNDLEMASKRMRRTFECDCLNIAPFTSKPMFGDTLRISSDVHVPNNLKEVKRLDRIWMMSHAINIPTPMWVGFNVKIITDKTGTQDIFYLTPINQSPTQNSVVYETMMRSVSGADECGQKYAEVHYDLAVASKALKIQSTVLRLETESPLSRLFIHLGSFHIAMSYFKAVGKYIENCGITDILIDSGLLASGSIRSFLEAKHFNRCKRLHSLIALTIEIMHFKYFLETENVAVDDECIAFLQHFQTREDVETPNNLISYRPVDNEQLLNLLEEYEIFRQKTINGDHGQTSKFYLIYVEMINNYLIFDRSIRTGDVELFKYSLPAFLNLFFTFNHQNYARNLTLYYSNLQNVEKTHPGLTVNIGIKRTKKAFSKREVDCTVETTINAKRMTGVTWLENSISARHRWSKSHSIRTQVISHVFAESLLKPRDEITNDLSEHKIKKSCEEIQKLQKSINDRLNPFSPTLNNELLYNICNGESASNEVQTFLLNVVEIGEEQRKRFLQECALDPKRFQEPITKNKVCTFKTKKIIKRNDGKIEEVKIQRDLFGRLLGISLERKVEIEKVLEYPLTPVPLSLCHLDGSINKTDNSKLIDPILKRERIEKTVPNELNAIVIDGFFYLYTLRHIPTTFGAISHNILRNITNHVAKEIHLVFDTYPEPSIKDYEHKIRANIRQTNFVIEGPQMKRPSNFFAELKNIKFKQAFVKFLINDWMTQDRVSLIKPTQTIFINYEICYSYRRVADSIVREVSDTFTCAHEKADTKVVYHVCNMPKNSNILIKCSDTDIFIIVLANMKHLLVHVAEDQYAIDRKIWMQLGTGNNVRNVDMCAVFYDLGEKLCTSLAAFHAFTGCDFNPSFYRKAKTRLFQLLLKSPKFQEAFTTMGEYTIVTDPDVMNTTFDVIQDFVCVMYNVKAVSTVNEARCIIFDRIYKPKNENEAFRKKTSKLEATAFPPSCRELQQQMRRATYIAQIWCNANVQNPSTLTPVNYGWNLIEKKYEFHWFDGEEYPVKVIDIIEEVAETDKDVDESTDGERDGEGELTYDVESTEYETDNESDEDAD